jgi:hypothetical protein
MKNKAKASGGFRRRQGRRNRKTFPAIQSTRLSIRGVGGVDPVARSLRSPELHRRPEPEYH